MIEDLVVDPLPRAGDELADSGPRPTAEQGMALRALRIQPPESRQLSGVESEPPQGAQVRGTLATLIDVNRDRGRDSQLHRRRQEPGKTGFDPRTSDPLAQAAEV